jgi:glycosyltransferase involved in cell wall biosynthesis
MARLQADAIVTVSEYSKDRLRDKFNIPGERIHVVGEASDPIFQKYEEPNWSTRLEDVGINKDERYFIYVGGFGPHKNISTLISVFGKLVSNPQYADVKLILVGEYLNEVFFSESRSLQSQIQELSLDESVIFTGYLPDGDLVKILNRAQGLVLPSLMEGFGLPAVEAAACGCPVIATIASPLPSLLGKAGIYIDPLDQQELLNALVSLLDSKQLREQMGVLGLQSAAALTWDKAAIQFKSIIDDLTSS